MEKLFDLELNEQEQKYFEVIRIQAQRATPQFMQELMRFHKELVEKGRKFNLGDDEGRRIEFYECVVKYLKNMLVMNF